MPIRIQRRRTKGWRMPDGAINVTRPGKWGNPFRIGGYFKIGKGGDGFSYLECLGKEWLTPDFVLIEDAQMAVDWFRRYVTIYPPKDIEELRGKDLCCWCKLSKACHVSVLLEIANS